MTPQEMQELDVWLAENVMGWDKSAKGMYWILKNREPSGYFQEGVRIASPVWQPTTNIAQAWEVLEKITEPPKSIEAAKRASNTRFVYWFEDARLWAMTTQEAALEISVNAKKAWEGK